MSKRIAKHQPIQSHLAAPSFSPLNLCLWYSPTTATMPGIAAIVNNAVSDGKSIQCFHNTNNLNLGLVLENGAADGDDPEKAFIAKSSDQKGIIVNPSQVGATEHLGINLIVGITQPVLASGTTTYTKYDVSIISPVYKPLTQTEANNRSITACSYEKKTWVYYLG